MRNTIDHTCIRRYLNRHEAELDRALLDSCGFKSVVQADDAGGMQPHLAFGNGGVKLLVTADIADEALAVLEQAT
jgi:hypothetical protein